MRREVPGRETCVGTWDGHSRDTSPVIAQFGRVLCSPRLLFQGWWDGDRLERDTEARKTGGCNQGALVSSTALVLALLDGENREGMISPQKIIILYKNRY
jgi:hypothetical protein